MKPPEPVALPSRTDYPCGCTVTWHLAPVRGRSRNVRIATFAGSCDQRTDTWTGNDFRQHQRDLLEQS